MKNKIVVAIISIMIMATAVGCDTQKVDKVEESTEQVTTVYATEPSDQATDNRITKTGPYGEIGITLPEGWTYDISSRQESQNFNGLYGISIYSNPEKEGAIEIAYWTDFGVCGTGLETENVTIAGSKAIKGYYDGSKNWSYICFEDGDLKGLVINNIQPDSEQWTAEIYEQLDQILETLTFDQTKKEGADCVYTKDAEAEEVGVYMYLENITNTSATVVFEQYEKENSGITGKEYAIEYYDGDDWVEVGKNGPIGFKDLAIIIEHNKPVRMEVDWTEMYGELRPGTYRLRKTIDYDKKYTLYSQFILN